MYKLKQLHQRIKNIHSYAHTMDDKWILILIINKDTSDKSCRHLVGIERPSPPLEPLPLQSSISMESLQGNENIGKRNNVCSKGQRDEDSRIRK